MCPTLQRLPGVTELKEKTLRLPGLQRHETQLPGRYNEEPLNVERSRTDKVGDARHGRALPHLRPRIECQRAYVVLAIVEEHPCACHRREGNEGHEDIEEGYV